MSLSVSTKQFVNAPLYSQPMQCSSHSVKVPVSITFDVTTKGHWRRGVCGHVELGLGGCGLHRPRDG